MNIKRIPWNKGKTLSDEHKRKLSLSHMGHKHSDEHKKKIGISVSKALTGRKLSKKHRLSLSKAKIGRRSNHYTGLWPLNTTIRGCYNYIKWRNDIFERDNYTCSKCNKHGGYLEVHHIKQLSKIVKDNNLKTINEADKCAELWNLHNGITLCLDCHIKYDKYRNGINKYQGDGERK